MVDRALAEGRTLRSIAERCGTSPQSVMRHRDDCESLILPPVEPLPAELPEDFQPLTVMELTEISRESMAINLRIARKFEESDPAIASVASSRASNVSTRLLQTAAELESSRRLEDEVRELRRVAEVAQTGQNLIEHETDNWSPQQALKASYTGAED